MHFLSNPNNLGVVLLGFLFVFLNWKSFLGSFNYRKIFDFTFLFLIFGYLFERTIFILQSKTLLSDVGFNFVSFEKLPWVVLNLDSYQGFTLVNFFAGGLAGLAVYNILNTVNKVDFKALSLLMRLFFLSLIPWLLISVGFEFFEGSIRVPEVSDILLPLIRLVVIGVVLAVYQFRLQFWEEKPGFFSAFAMLLFAISEIVLDYLNPGFDPEIFGVFSVGQLVAIMLIIISINIFLTALSNIQDSIIRKKYAPEKQFPSRGFTLSFANKRRISNPLNIRLKNLKKNAARTKRNRGL